MDKTNIYFTDKNNLDEIVHELIVLNNYDLEKQSFEKYIFYEVDIINIVKGIYQNLINEINNFYIEIETIYKTILSDNNYKQLFNNYKKSINNFISKITNIYKKNNNILNFTINSNNLEKNVILYKIFNKIVNKFYIIPSININYNENNYELIIIIKDNNKLYNYFITPIILLKNKKINKADYISALRYIISKDESIDNILKLKHFFKIEYKNFHNLFPNNMLYT